MAEVAALECCARELAASNRSTEGVVRQEMMNALGAKNRWTRKYQQMSEDVKNRSAEGRLCVVNLSQPSAFVGGWAGW